MRLIIEMRNFLLNLRVVKKLIAVIFLFIFSMQIFYAAVVNCWFYANRSYVTQKYCVNKDRPTLKCNGKCYLNKQLKKAEEKGDSDTPKQTKKWEEISACKVPAIHYTLNFPAEIHLPKPVYTDVYYFDFNDSVFHPPTAAFS